MENYLIKLELDNSKVPEVSFKTLQNWNSIDYDTFDKEAYEAIEKELKRLDLDINEVTCWRVYNNLNEEIKY